MNESGSKFAGFGDSLTANVINFDRNAIPEPDTLLVSMTRGERKIADELRKAFGGFRRVVIDVDGERHEFGADSLIRLLENYEQVSKQNKRENDSKRESYGEVCGDGRFELIGKARARLLEATNIEMCPDEMAALGDILFRCWQMGWLDQLREDNSRYAELFGTPERAANTSWYMLMCRVFDCSECPIAEGCKIANDDYCENGYDALLEWLKGESQ